MISSSWRLIYTIDQLINFFSEDIKPRLVGVTPEIECPKNKLWRQAEIEAWLESTQYAGGWIALDDAVSEFEANHPNLIATDPSIGLSLKEIEKLNNFNISI